MRGKASPDSLVMVDIQSVKGNVSGAQPALLLWQRSEQHVRSADPSSCGGSASHNHSKNSVSVLQKAAVRVKLRRLGGGGSTLLHLFVLLVKGTCSQQHGRAADLAPVSCADWSEEERESVDLVQPGIGLGGTPKRVSCFASHVR